MRKGSTSGRMAMCHPDLKHYGLGLCQKCYNTNKSKKHAERRSEAYYQNKYGISAGEANEARTKAKVCSLCGKTNGRYNGTLHIDHDHKTNRLRGVLCFKCNSFIGYLEKRFPLLPRALAYLGVNASISLREDQLPILQ